MERAEQSDVSGSSQPGSGPAATGANRARTIHGPRVQGWQVVLLVAALFTPAAVWLGLSQSAESATVAANDPEPSSPTVSRPVLPTRITVTRATPRPSTTRATPTRRTSPPLTSPPKLVRPTSIPLAPIPTRATTIRFEVHVVGGGDLAVSFYDGIHARTELPPTKDALAFEVPVATGQQVSPYFSVFARSPRPLGNGGAVGPDILCRVVVDGVVVSTRQGRGSTSCSISPGTDLRQR